MTAFGRMTISLPFVKLPWLADLWKKIYFATWRSLLFSFVDTAHWRHAFWNPCRLVLRKTGEACCPFVTQLIKRPTKQPSHYHKIPHFIFTNVIFTILHLFIFHCIRSRVNRAKPARDLELWLLFETIESTRESYRWILVPRASVVHFWLCPVHISLMWCFPSTVHIHPIHFTSIIPVILLHLIFPVIHFFFYSHNTIMVVLCCQFFFQP